MIPKSARSPFPKSGQECPKFIRLLREDLGRFPRAKTDCPLEHNRGEWKRSFGASGDAMCTLKPKWTRETVDLTISGIGAK
jgi:hypothetical protein